MERYNGLALRKFPSPIDGIAGVGVQVTVKLNGVIATLYEGDNLAGAQLPNPLTADSNGYFGFYAPDGVYTAEFSNGTPIQVIQLVDQAAVEQLAEDLQQGYDDFIDTQGLVYNDPDTFTTGSTLDGPNVALRRASDGEYFRRIQGPYPYVVTPGTDPAADPLYVAVGSASLRSDLANGTADVGGVQSGYLSKRGEIKLSEYDVTVDADEAVKIQQLFDDCQSAKMVAVIDVNVKSSAAHEIDNDLHIVFRGGEIEFTGDEDRFIESLNTASYLIVENANIVDNSVFGTRTALHRGITKNGGGSLYIIDPLKIEGFSNAVHALGCDYFYTRNGKCSKVLGTAAQSGYGYNSSAKTTIIDGLKFDNSEAPLNGRHAVYINSECEHFSINNLDVDGCVHNPINIALAETVHGYGSVNNVNLKNVNTSPLAVSANCINITDNNTGTAPENVVVSIDGVSVEGYSGGLVSIPTNGYVGSSIRNITAKGFVDDLSGLAYSQVFVRDTTDVDIDTIKILSDIPANNFVVQIRDSAGVSANKIKSKSITGTMYRLDGATTCRLGKADRNAAMTLLSSVNGSTYQYDHNEKQAAVTVGGAIDATDIKYLTKSVAGNVTVSSFTGGVEGQVLYYSNVTDNTTFTHNTSEIATRAATDLTLTPRQTATFIRTGSRWLQVN